MPIPRIDCRINFNHFRTTCIPRPVTHSNAFPINLRVAISRSCRLVYRGDYLSLGPAILSEFNKANELLIQYSPGHCRWPGAADWVHSITMIKLPKRWVADARRCIERLIVKKNNARLITDAPRREKFTDCERRTQQNANDVPWINKQLPGRRQSGQLEKGKPRMTATKEERCSTVAWIKFRASRWLSVAWPSSD